MSNQLQITPPSPDNSDPNVEIGYVTLPISQSQFSDFINSLLGSSQAINGKFEFPFELQRKDIRKIHNRFEQRITQQNGGKLVRFFARIDFSDGISQELMSIEELETFIYVDNGVAERVYVRWDYLIKFSDKDFVEKQQINLYFDTQGEQAKRNLSRRSGNSKYCGRISFRIEHTARTWGNDISRDLQNFADELNRKNNVNFFNSFCIRIIDQYPEFFKRGSLSPVPMLVVIMFLATLLFIGIFSALTVSSSSTLALGSIITIENFNELKGSFEMANSPHKVEEFVREFIKLSETSFADREIVNETNKRASSRFISILGSLSILMFLVLFVRSFIPTYHSFLLFSQASKTYKTKRLRSENNSFLAIMASIIFSVILGVLINIFSTPIIEYLTS